MIGLPLVGFFACGNERETSSEIAAEGSRVSTRQQQPLTIRDEALNAIYPHYQKLTDALVDGKAGEAKLSASNIEAGAAQVNESALLQQYARQLLAASTLEAQRVAYTRLSDEYIALVKKAGVKNGELYEAFCPMANGDKGGFWLSGSKEIRNPYFGKEMLSCGIIEETIRGESTKTAL